MAIANPFKGIFASRKNPRRRAVAPPRQSPPPLNISDLFQQPVKTPDGAGARKLPSFQSTAGDQLDAARTDRFAQARLKVRNAFTPSQPVSDRRFFAGRRDVLTHMIRALEDQRQHLVLYGERGIGKTSLLHILIQAAREARYIAIYWSCGANSNFDETFRAAAAEIPLLYHGGFAPTALESEHGGSLADLLPTTRVSPRIFGELCAKITGTRVLIILDEFDRAESAEFRREIAELIKILSDRSVRVEILIAGVAADLAELVEHIPSIRRNIQTFRIPLMTPEEVQELVQTGARTSGLTFSPAAQDLVVSAACGSPYLTALICHHASLAAIDARRSEVQAEDVSGGIAEAATELRDRIPRKVKQQTDRLIAKDARRALAVLAGASLASGGDFDDSAIDVAAASTSEATLCKRLSQEIAAEGGIITAYDLDGRRRYSFVEEGLPSYLWLLSVVDRGADGKVTGKRALTG